MKPEPPREILTPVRLTTEDGRLAPQAIGWSRRSLHDARLVGSPGRKKRWSYWGIAGEDAVLAITIADVDYLGLVVVSLLDVTTGRFVEEVSVLPFGGGLALPDEERGADIVIRRPKLSVSIVERHDETQISFDVPGKRLRGELVVDRTPESLSVVIPWSQTRFQLTTKAIAMPVRGSVITGDREQRFDSPDAYACLDFGRGIWPYQTRWQWAAAAGEASGQTVGFNLGGAWTDGTGQNENGIVIGGRFHKIHDDVDFEMDATGCPWRITTRAGADSVVDLVFQPRARRRVTLEALALGSRLRWGYGYFHGSIALAGGPEIRVDRMRGWAEDHSARW